MATDEKDCSPIPHPRGLPFLGDALEFTGDEAPIMLTGSMARQYGRNPHVQMARGALG